MHESTHAGCVYTPVGGLRYFDYADRLAANSCESYETLSYADPSMTRNRGT